MVPGSIILPIGLLLTGWCAQKGIHWVVTDIGIAFVGAGMILNFQAIADVCRGYVYVVRGFR